MLCSNTWRIMQSHVYHSFEVKMLSFNITLVIKKICLYVCGSFESQAGEIHMNKSSVLISHFWNLKLNLVGVKFTWTNPVLITPLNLIATYCLSVICLSRKHCHFNILSTTVCNYNQCMVLHLFAAQRPAEKRSWTVVQAFKKGALPSSTLY